MATLDLHISGEFFTRGFSFYYPDFKENGFRPTEVEDSKEIKRLVSSVDKSAYCLKIRTYDRGDSHLQFLARQADLISGSFNIEADGKSPRIKATVDGVFRLTIDDSDQIKYLKKNLKTGVGFAITDVHFQRDEIGFSPFGMEGGVIDNIDWDAYDKMPQAQILSTDIVDINKKPAKSKAKPDLALPIKADFQVQLKKEAVEGTKKAIDSGIQLVVGLEIKGGLNSFIVRPDQINGSCSIVLNNTKLLIKIDGFVNFKEDAWIKKYRSQAPFAVTLNSYWDSEGVVRHLGKYNKELDYYETVQVGELHLD